MKVRQLTCLKWEFIKKLYLAGKRGQQSNI